MPSSPLNMKQAVINHGSSSPLNMKPAVINHGSSSPLNMKPAVINHGSSSPLNMKPAVINYGSEVLCYTNTTLDQDNILGVLFLHCQILAQVPRLGDTFRK